MHTLSSPEPEQPKKSEYSRVSRRKFIAAAASFLLFPRFHFDSDPPWLYAKMIPIDSDFGDPGAKIQKITVRSLEQVVRVSHSDKTPYQTLGNIPDRLLVRGPNYTAIMSYLDLSLLDIPNRAAYYRDGHGKIAAGLLLSSGFGANFTNSLGEPTYHMGISLRPEPSAGNASAGVWISNDGISPEQISPIPIIFARQDNRDNHFLPLRINFDSDDHKYTMSTQYNPNGSFTIDNEVEILLPNQTP